MLKFLTESGMCDSNFNQRKAELQFLSAACSGKSGGKNKINPPNSLVRFEFLECLVRCALEKYVKGGITNSITEGIKLMITKHIIPFA